MNKKYLNLFFILYIIALHSSLAAMEFFSCAAIAYGLFLTITKKEFYLPNTTVSLSLLGYLGVTIIAYKKSESPDTLLRYISYSRWIFIYFGLYNFFHQIDVSKINWKEVLKPTKYFYILTLFYAIYQSLYAVDLFRPNSIFHKLYTDSQYFRPNGYFNLPTSFATSLTMFLVLILAEVLTTKPYSAIKDKWLTFTFLISQTALNILSFTRAAWISFFITSLFLISLTRKKLLFPVLLGFFTFIAIFHQTNDSFRNRLNSTINFSYEGNFHRLHLWNAYTHMFMDNPIFGTGLEENFRSVDKYLVKLKQPTVLRSHAHNIYLNVLSSTGLLGFILFLFFIFDHLYLCFRETISKENRNFLYPGVLGLQTVVFTIGFVDCSFTNSRAYHFYLFFICLIKAFESLKIDKQPLSWKQFLPNSKT